MMGFKQICGLIATICFFTGCGEDNNPVNPTGESKLTSPSATSVTSDFTVTSFNIGKPQNNTNYFYGVGEIQYTGTTPLMFVKIFVTFKSSSGSVLYRDTTYIHNVTTTSDGDATPIYTNAFVSTANPKGYYTLIDNKPLSLVSISNVEFAFEGESFVPTDPVSIVALSGNPYESSGMLHQNFTNNGSESVNMESSLFIFKNSSGVSYSFTYPNIYRKQETGYTESDIIDADASGRLSCSSPVSDIETQPFTIKQTLLNWDAAKVLAKKSFKNISDPQARLKAFRNAIDDEIDNLRKR